MSMLKNATVNPMTQPPAAPAPEPTQHVAYQAEPGPALPDPEYVPAQNLPAMTAQTSMPVPAQPVEPAEQTSGEFTCLETGFGSFPRVKVNRGKFEIDDKPFAASFVANIFDARSQYVYRDRDDDDKNTRVLWSYDQRITTSGELIEQEIAKWEAEGFMDHDMKRYVEAVATITSCPESPEVEGQVVLLSIPPTSEKRMAGYQVVLKRTRNKHIPDVLTLIKADTIASSSRTWDAWVFSFAGLAM